jgi:DNA-binding NtrC family response regulator
VDVRILSATNADLRAEVAAGRFREDLLFRLNTIEIRLPPLRERPEDVRALAEYFLARYAARYRKPVAGFEPEALAALHAYLARNAEPDHTPTRGAAAHGSFFAVDRPAGRGPPG